MAYMSCLSAVMPTHLSHVTPEFLFWCQWTNLPRHLSVYTQKPVALLPRQRFPPCLDDSCLAVQALKVNEYSDACIHAGMLEQIPACMSQLWHTCIQDFKKTQHQMFYFPDSLFPPKNGWTGRHMNIFHNLHGKTWCHNKPEAEVVWKRNTCNL